MTRFFSPSPEDHLHAKHQQLIAATVLPLVPGCKALTACTARQAAGHAEIPLTAICFPLCMHEVDQIPSLGLTFASADSLQGAAAF